MYIRKLQEKDAPFMLEWMHDENAVEYLANNFMEMKLESCIQFIQNSKEEEENLHFAICNEQDEYLGTVSLKHIDLKNGNAEYAIAMRSSAMGTGASKVGTEKILEKAFKELKLNRVYLNVVDENIRANKFYEKIGFSYEGVFKEHLFINGRYRNLKWYAMTKKEYESRKDSL